MDVSLEWINVPHNDIKFKEINMNIFLRLIFFCMMTLSFFNANAATVQPQKILMVVSSHSELGNTGKKTGYWLAELSHPLMVLLNKGYQVDIASPLGGNAPIDPRSMKLDDPINKKLMTTPTLVYQIQHTIPLKDVNPANYSAIFFAGGHGPMWDLTNNATAANLINSIYAKGGVVAAVCHGPAALVNVKLANNQYLIANKHLTAFSNAEEQAVGLTQVMPYSLQDELKQHGAIYSAAAPMTPHLVVDGRLITGQNPESATDVGNAIAQQLAGK